VLGRDTVPAIILNEFDEDRRKFMMVKLNVLKGKLNPLKLAELVGKYRQKYEKDTLRKLLGMSNRAVFDKVYEDVKKSLPDEVKKSLEKSKASIQTVDQLSSTIREIFNAYGSTVPFNFIFFNFGGKKHIMIRSNAELFHRLNQLAEAARFNQQDINDVLLQLLNRPTDQELS
jgi:hypothetical protein